MSIQYLIIFSLFLILLILVLYRIWLGRNQEYKEKYEIGMCKTIGSKEIQMDYFTVEQNQNGMLAVLSDGMGKDSGGKIASKTVIHVFKELFANYNMLDHPSYFFQKAFQTANREILKLLDEGRGNAVASSIMIKEDKLYYAIVGNVKVAVYRNNELVPLGAGHTVNVLAENKYYQGVLSQDHARAMLTNCRIYNYLGRDGFNDIKFYDEPIQLHYGDIVVLMSDGIYEAIEWKYIEDYLGQKKKLNDIAFEMIEKINHKQGEKDNASVVLIKVGELI